MTGPTAPASSLAGSPRTVVLSQRSVARRVWHASQYELEDVVAEVDDVALLTPASRDTRPSAPALRSASNALRSRSGLPPTSELAQTEVAHGTDLFFGVFASAPELRHLRRVSGLDRARRKVAFVVELWAQDVDRHREQLKLLRGFDHVFLFSRNALPGLREVTGVPASYLATATDVLRFAPRTPAPPRMVDVHAYGRGLRGTHLALLAAHEAGRLSYLFPTLVPGDVTDHRQHRLQLAAMLQRSRYTVVYRNNDGPNRLLKTGGEDSLTNRYFEAVAAGSVVVGSASQAPDFADCFPWPDAVVPIAAPDPDVEAALAALDADPQRVHRARTTGVEQSLRRHDWAHRWQVVLDAAGLPTRPALEQRLGRLDARADAWVAGQALQAP